MGCFQEIQNSKLITAPCEHQYCRQCIKEMGRVALKEIARFPVRCCSQEIPAYKVASAMSSRARKIYIMRKDEHAVLPEERLYCPQPNCRRWISTRGLTTKSKVRCPHCRTPVCSNCRDIAHGDRECARDPALEEVLGVARRYRWQRCYNCHVIVEKMTGCLHMTCHCSAEFW